MKPRFEIVTRAGEALPPAIAWRALARRALPLALLAVGLLLALAVALGLAEAATAADRAGGPAPPPVNSGASEGRGWGWGMRPDSTADSAAVRRRAPAALPDSLPGAAAVPGRRDSAAVRRTAPARSDSLAGPPPVIPPAPEPRPGGPFEYVWVVRTALLTPSDVDRVVERAKAEHVRGLLVQVVGRGDAYYRSDHLPRAEALPPGDFDPLDRMIRAAHAAGIEVHAWMNCMLVWSAPQPPRDPRHVLREHPDWVARLRDGRPLTRLTPRQRERLGIEGVFLAPARPAVRAWIAGTAAEIVRRYPVDGLQLDYIRQPVVAVGWDPDTRARFALESGVDPARFDRVPAADRARVDSLWLAFQCDQVRATVAEIRDTVERIRPGLPLSAAVVADTLTAERHDAQRWRQWLRAGLLDRAFVMCYAPPVQTVLDQLLGVVNSFGADGRVVPGIAVYNASPSTAAAKILGARAMGFPDFAIYSYDALAARPGYWDRLRELLSPQTLNARPPAASSAGRPLGGTP